MNEQERTNRIEALTALIQSQMWQVDDNGTHRMMSPFSKEEIQKIKKEILNLIET